MRQTHGILDLPVNIKDELKDSNIRIRMSLAGIGSRLRFIQLDKENLFPLKDQGLIFENIRHTTNQILLDTPDHNKAYFVVRWYYEKIMDRLYDLKQWRKLSPIHLLTPHRIPSIVRFSRAIDVFTEVIRLFLDEKLERIRRTSEQTDNLLILGEKK